MSIIECGYCGHEGSHATVFTLDAGAKCTGCAKCQAESETNER